MKLILTEMSRFTDRIDMRFAYTPATSTDIRKTIARERKRLASLANAENGGRMSFPPTDPCYGDEGIIDLEPYMQEALEYVVDIITLYGQFPRPYQQTRKQFDLYEWMTERMQYDLQEFAFSMTLELDRQAHAEMRDAWQDKIRARLMDELADGQMVIDVAEQLRSEDND